MVRRNRRQFVTGLASSVGTIGLAGCLGGFPGAGVQDDRTVYVGAYHWGFVVLDEEGTEHEQLVLDPGTRVRLVAFNTEADGALERLPRAVRSALPDHEALEERNEERIPEPPTGDMHEALADANERYPDHSVAVLPSGGNHMQGPMGGEMMHNSITLPHDATRPATTSLVANQRGDYTISCLTYCGYGHPFMEVDGAFVVP